MFIYIHSSAKHNPSGRRNKFWHASYLFLESICGFCRITLPQEPAPPCSAAKVSLLSLARLAMGDLLTISNRDLTGPNRLVPDLAGLLHEDYWPAANLRPVFLLTRLRSLEHSPHLTDSFQGQISYRQSGSPGLSVACRKRAPGITPFRWGELQANRAFRVCWPYASLALETAQLPGKVQRGG